MWFGLPSFPILHSTLCTQNVPASWRALLLSPITNHQLLITSTTATNAPHPFLFSFLRYDAGGWGDYADAVAGKIGAILFARCVARVEGEGKDVETECCEKGLTVEWVAD